MLLFYIVWSYGDIGLKQVLGDVRDDAFSSISSEQTQPNGSAVLQLCRFTVSPKDPLVRLFS